MKSKDDLMK